jgi:hypothetical protein
MILLLTLLLFGVGLLTFLLAALDGRISQATAAAVSCTYFLLTSFSFHVTFPFVGIVLTLPWSAIVLKVHCQWIIAIIGVITFEHPLEGCAVLNALLMFFLLSRNARHNAVSDPGELENLRAALTVILLVIFK